MTFWVLFAVNGHFNMNLSMFFSSFLFVYTVTKSFSGKLVCMRLPFNASYPGLTSPLLFFLNAFVLRGSVTWRTVLDTAGIRSVIEQLDRKPFEKHNSFQAFMQQEPFFAV